jgi:hypothetical protein
MRSGARGPGCQKRFDRDFAIVEIACMKTKEASLPAGDFAADEAAVMASLMSGTPLDAEVARRIHERAMRIREQIRQEHGLVDIAVPAIREFRGELLE